MATEIIIGVPRPVGRGNTQSSQKLTLPACLGLLRTHRKGGPHHAATEQREPSKHHNAGAQSTLCAEYRKNNAISRQEYETHRVKRGLRNPDGTGVMAGLTHVCNVHGYLIDDGDKIPDQGRLTYRGINIEDIVSGCQAEGRFGFEEVVWLLIFGKLPDRRQ